MKDAVALFATVCGVVGLMLPLLPAEGVTVQLARFAEQDAVEPPPGLRVVLIRDHVKRSCLPLNLNSEVPPSDLSEGSETTGGWKQT